MFFLSYMIVNETFFGLFYPTVGQGHHFGLWEVVMVL